MTYVPFEKIYYIRFIGFSIYFRYSMVNPREVNNPLYECYCFKSVSNLTIKPLSMPVLELVLSRTNAPKLSILSYSVSTFNVGVAVVLPVSFSVTIFVQDSLQKKVHFHKYGEVMFILGCFYTIPHYSCISSHELMNFYLSCYSHQLLLILKLLHDA